jgi:acyl-CoA reductase-like NAD-dependent aldehyde dehydrogenase
LHDVAAIATFPVMTQSSAGSNVSRVGVASAANEPTVIKSYEPVSGDLIGEVPVMSAGEVNDVIKRARRAQEAWALLGFEQRAERLFRFRDLLIERADEVVDLLARETGKPRFEALTHELSVVADQCTYFGKNAARFLRSKERALHLAKNRKAIVSYAPRGVIGSIAPWNFPLQMPFRDVVVAAMAGNAAVVKPSEVTPMIMMKAKEIWDASGMPPDLLGVVTGHGATGAALIDGGIDMCVFTGSVATGRRVAAACGERLIPCVMELGGNAPLIACSDCDIEHTARAIVFGGFSNSGQACVSVERVYAHREVYERVLDRVVELTGKLKHGDPTSDCDLGGITFAPQIDVAEAHIEDALEKGAKLRIGGKRREGAKMVFEPTVLADCTHECTVMTGEIFGPIVPFMKVASEEEALQLANDSRLGLNAYIFTEDAVRGRRLAERLDAGSVLINAVLLNGGMPDTPFGGIKDSGFGRVMGREGIRSMCNVKHINLERFKSPLDKAIAFPYTAKGYKLIEKATRALNLSGGIFKRVSELF